MERYSQGKVMKGTRETVRTVSTITTSCLLWDRLNSLTVFCQMTDTSSLFRLRTSTMMKIQRVRQTLKPQHNADTLLSLPSTSSQTAASIVHSIHPSPLVGHAVNQCIYKKRPYSRLALVPFGIFNVTNNPLTFCSLIGSPKKEMNAPLKYFGQWFFSLQQSFRTLYVDHTEPWGKK